MASFCVEDKETVRLIGIFRLLMTYLRRFRFLKPFIGLYVVKSQESRLCIALERK